MWRSTDLSIGYSPFCELSFKLLGPIFSPFSIFVKCGTIPHNIRIFTEIAIFE